MLYVLRTLSTTYIPIRYLQIHRVDEWIVSGQELNDTNAAKLFHPPKTPAADDLICYVLESNKCINKRTVEYE